LSYHEIEEHELAVGWLGDGIELAMWIDDPEGIIAQLSHFRRTVSKRSAATSTNWRSELIRFSGSGGRRRKRVAGGSCVQSSPRTPCR
jgi:hypothetical protein